MGGKWETVVRNNIVVRNPLTQEFLAELFGTFCLMGVGIGANMMYLLPPRLNTYFTVQLCWGFVVALSVWTTYGVSGGHINPAVTFAMATVGRLQWKKVPVYWLGQYIGCFIGAASAYMVYYEALNHFDGGNRAVTGVNATAAIFVTFPLPYVSTLGGFIDQIYGTMMLLVFIMALTDNRNAAPASHCAPIFFGVVVATVGMTYGMNCGYPLNPARDLSPRIFIAMAGWGTEVFTAYNYWSWVPIVAPHIGAVLGVWVYSVLVGMHLHHRGIQGKI